MTHAPETHVPHAGQSLDRRGVLTALAGTGAAFALATRASGQEALPKTVWVDSKKPLEPSMVAFDANKSEYVLPPLPYAFDALAPAIDAKTMEIHHDKHHAAYVAGANKALQELAAIRSGGDAAMVKHWARELSFHVGGHVNHTLFWNMMAPSGNGAGKGGGGEPTGTLAAAITKDFGSFSQFAAHFKANATQVEGGGWGWLVYEPIARKLLLVQMQNQQDRMIAGTTPILGVDVWEHAYYLAYQNKRSDYVNAFMNVVNWPFCQRLFDAASA